MGEHQPAKPAPAQPVELETRFKIVLGAEHIDEDCRTWTDTMHFLSRHLPDGAPHMPNVKSWEAWSIALGDKDMKVELYVTGETLLKLITANTDLDQPISAEVFGAAQRVQLASTPRQVYKYVENFNPKQ